MKTLRAAAWLESAALVLFYLATLGKDSAETTTVFTIEVTAAGAFLISTLWLGNFAMARSWTGARWLVRLRALFAGQMLIILGLGSIMIFAVALFAMGRGSLVLPGAVLTLIAEVLVIVSAVKTLQ